MKKVFIVFFALLILASCRKKVEESAPVPVTSLEVEPATLKLQMSDSPKLLLAKVKPEEATNKNVTWNSSDPSKATVDATGLVSPVAKGTTTITATSLADPSKTAVCEVTVTGILVSEITISTTASTVAAGRDLQLTAMVKPENAENKEVTWSSNKTDIATVDATGKVRGVAIGSVVITATSKDEGPVSQAITLTVIPAATSIPLTGLSVNPAEVNLLVGGTQQLVTIFNPADASDKNVTWTSSDETKVTVSATGLVTAKALGTVDITVKSTNNPAISAVRNVTVTATAVAVASLEVNPATLRLQMSDSPKLLLAKVKPEGATNKNVTWNSSDPSKATVNATGLVSPVAKGTTTITATSLADPSKTAACVVTVTGILVSEITISTTASTVAAGRDLQLTAMVKPENAENKEVTWSSNKTDIATVDATGKVRGVAIGSVVITATSKDEGPVSQAITLTVIPAATSIPLTGLSVNPAEVNLLVGGTQQLVTIFIPADASDKNVTWTSSDETKATVSATGLVTAQALGTVDITVKSTNNPAISAVRNVTVTAAAVAVASLEVDPATLRLQMSDSPKLLLAKVEPQEATNKNVTWNSSDPSKATVNATGLVSPVAKGTTTITATSLADPSKTAACVVTVTGILVTEITISSITPPTQVRVGLELALTATVRPGNADNKEVTWSSDKTYIATVDATGKVRGVAKGSVVITATSKDEGAVTQTITITVKPTVTSITILPANPVVGTIATATTTLRATVLPPDAAQAVTWSSGDLTKATIDPSTGIVTGVAVGETTITATATDGSGITATKNVTVKSSDASVASITLGAENFNVNVPAPGAATTQNNAPHTIASNLNAIRVNITVAANASIKIGTTAFTSGGNANFTNPVAFTVTAEDGTTIKTYTVGIRAYNAASNPYGVYTAAHLNNVRNGKEKSYQLMNIITLPDNNAAGAASTGISDYATAGWLPIVHDIQGGLNSHDGFSGTFDGAGFRIENLYINRTTALGGLFGGGSGCTIKNLEVRGTTTKTSVAINSSSTEVYAAILIGSMNGGAITDCGVAGDVSSNKGNAGGLAGISTGTVTNCFATGNINAGSGDAGGLVGFSSGGPISKSYATGNVTGGYKAGGLTALINSGNITDCFATGNVSNSGRSGCSGLVGSVNNSTPITNSYATGNVNGSGSYIGALAGNFYSNPFTNCYRNSEANITKYGVNFTPLDASLNGLTPKTMAEMQADAFKGNLNGTSRTIWGREDGKNNRLPYIIGVGVGK